ncbi:hypothetical protein [Agrobacterium pusense]|uniref:hypothetical protein n=1 Tax=Agrobacterium pusense TaxID=648995 RepID=UPI0010AED931|nr:hypothetical protein [Agrobacterium pusense]WCK22955.1 hypothetical protein CFBP5496_0009335 [Agrobacterium pusense]
MKVLASLALLVSVSPALAQFNIDETAEALRKERGLYAIADLAISEKGLISYGKFCSVDGNLFADKTDLLASSKTEYGLNVTVEMQKGPALKLTAEPGQKAKETTKQYLAQALYRALTTPCDNYGIPPENRIPILSINEKSSASDLFKATD